MKSEIGRAMEDFLILRRCHSRVNRFSNGVSISDIEKAQGENRVKKLAQFLLNSNPYLNLNPLTSSKMRKILKDMTSHKKVKNTQSLFHAIEQITGYLKNWNITKSIYHKNLISLTKKNLILSMIFHIY